MQRHGDEELPQVAALFERTVPRPTFGKEATIDRLHHVLGINALGQLCRELAACQSDEPASVALEQFRRRGLISFLPSREQLAGLGVARRFSSWHRRLFDDTSLQPIAPYPWLPAFATTKM